MGASPGRASPADRDVLRPGGFACQMRAINTRARAREGADSACRWATPASHRGFDTSRVRSVRHILLKLAENAGWDPEMLRLDLGDLKFAGFDLSLTGFGELELGSLQNHSIGYVAGHMRPKALTMVRR